MPNVFRSKAVVVVSLVLLGQTAVFYAMPTKEYVPNQPPLTEFSRQLSVWRMTSEFPMEQEIADLLKADDTVNRQYADGAGNSLNLFVAFFRTQRAGVTPHSPKVCLPGSGWIPEDSRMIDVSVPGRSEPITINRYTVTRGQNKSIVLYWYQTPHRVVASEYMAKLYLMIDALRYNRSDTALVRVVSPVVEGRTPEQAEKIAVEFIRGFYSQLTSYLPS